MGKSVGCVATPYSLWEGSREFFGVTLGTPENYREIFRIFKYNLWLTPKNTKGITEFCIQ